MRKTWTERMAEGNRLIAEHKARMAEKYDVAGNEKFDLCYDLAWHEGHANGFDEVERYFSDFVKLIK